MVHGEQGDGEGEGLGEKASISKAESTGNPQFKKFWSMASRKMKTIKRVMGKLSH